MATGLIFDIKRFAIHDGPGLRTTVFFKGCPLACGMCHNPESRSPEREILLRSERCVRCGECVAACRTGALSMSEGELRFDRSKCVRCGECVAACAADARAVVGREVSAEEVMAEIERDVVFYDESGGGATFSGGEPLGQPEFLRALLRLCRERYVHAAVDTSGFAPREVVRDVGPLADLFLYDVKLMDPGRHEAFTGASNEGILGNLRELVDGGCDVVVRLPLVGGVNDDRENVEALGSFLSSLPSPPPVEILPYHGAGVHKYGRLGHDYPLPEAKAPAKETLARTEDTLRGFGLRVTINGA